MNKKIILVIAMLTIFFCLSGEEAPKNLPDFDRMWDFQDPAGSEARFTEILPFADKDGNISYKAQLLSQIARAQGMQGKFDEAHETLNKADEIIEPLNKLASVRILLERGRIYTSENKLEIARPLFVKALETSQINNQDIMTIDAIHMLGIIDPPEMQITWNIKAMEIAESSEDHRVKGWLGPLYNNIGWSYFDLGDYENAQIMFKNSLAFRESQADEQGIRIAKWTIGHLYRVTNRLDEALDIQHALENEFNEKELPKDGYVLEELAELYQLKGEKQKAKKYYLEAWQELSKDNWLTTNEPERIERLKQMAE